MRYVLQIALCLILSVIAGIVSAQTKNDNVRQTGFSGKFEKPPRQFFLIEREGKSDTVNLAADGTFRLSIQQVIPEYFVLRMGKNSLNIFLIPGDNFEATFTNSLVSANTKFTGKSAAFNEYLVSKSMKESEAKQILPDFKWSTTAPDVFLHFIDSVKNSRLIALKKAEEKLTGSDFIRMEQRAIDYRYANDLIQYRQVAEERFAPLPATVTDPVYKINRDDAELAWHEDYLSFAQNFVRQESAIAYNQGSDKSYLHYYELQVEKTCDLFKNEKCRNAIYGRVIQDVIKDVGTQDLTLLLQKFESCCTNTAFVNRVKKYASQFEYLYAGKPAPDAAFYDTTNKVMHLSDFKGKLLYVDVWATWCGPCKREIPELIRLEEEYKGKNIHFLSVSTDKDVNTWRNYLRKNKMAGMQTHQSDSPSENMSNLYMVNSIPRFILIDVKGNIISADAPRSGKRSADQGTD